MTLHCRRVCGQPDEDIRLSGKVTSVGTSSLETTVVLEQLDAGQWETITKAEMVMVARDPLNTGSAVVNPLIADTPEEQQMVQAGKGGLLGVVSPLELGKWPPGGGRRRWWSVPRLSWMSELYVVLCAPSVNKVRRKGVSEQCAVLCASSVNKVRRKRMSDQWAILCAPSVNKVRRKRMSEQCAVLCALSVNKVRRKRMTEQCAVLCAPSVNKVRRKRMSELCAVLCAPSVNKVRRKRMSEQSLFKLPPTQTEVALIHQVFIDTVDHGTFRQRQPEDALFMSDTKLKNLIICHPEVSPRATGALPTAGRNSL